MARETLTTYSDADALINASEFAPGDTVYIAGEITSLFATSGTTVKLEIYDEATDTLQATPLDTTYDFVANTPATIYAINSDAAPTWATAAAQAEGEYYMTLTIGSQTLDIGFKVSGAPSSIWFDTTAEFDSGTLVGTYAENDNLYAGYYENFDDQTKADWLTAYGGWEYTSGDAAVTIASQYGRAWLITTTAMSAPNIRMIHTYGKSTSNAETPMNYLALVDKVTQPGITETLNYDVRVWFERRAAPSNDWRLFIAYHNGTQLVYWDGSTWTTTLSAAATITSVHAEPFDVFYISDGTNWYIDITTPVDITTATVPVSSLRNYDSVNYWAFFGKPEENYTQEILYTFDVRVFPSTWTSPAITPPTDKKFKYMQFILSNGSSGVNEISGMDILDASNDAVIDTSTKALSASGYYYASDFTNYLRPTYNTPFKIKAKFRNGGTAILTIASIEGWFSIMSYARMDGGVFQI